MDKSSMCEGTNQISESAEREEKAEYTEAGRKKLEFRVHRYLSKWYRKLAFVIAKHSLFFIVIPMVVSAALSTGLLYMSINYDVEYLFSPENAVSLQDRRFIHKWFANNSTEVTDPSRIPDHGEFGALIAVAKDGGSMLRESIFKNIKVLDDFIHNITVEHEGILYAYKDICAENEDGCLANEILKHSWKIKRLESMKERIRFPIDYSNVTYNYTIYVMNLGGVSCDESGLVEEVKAIRLLYYLKNYNQEQVDIAQKWQEKFMHFIGKLNLENISVFLFSRYSLNTVMRDYMDRVPPVAIITGSVMLIYSVLSCMRLDLVTSKPWLGVAGLCSVLLALASTFGLLSYCKVQVNTVAGMVAFLIFGIGMDDAFILIGAWRQTNPTEEVPKRLANAYSEAATSITITSLTNTLCFCVSITIPFPGLRVFCLYAVTAVFFVFVYQLTFFGACMTFSGYREARNLDPFTFRPVPSCIPNGRRFRGLYFQRRSDEQISEKDKKKEASHRGSSNCYFRSISYVETRIAIFLVVVIFLCVSLWSCFHLTEGQEFSLTFPYNSSSSLFLEMMTTYFSQFSYRLQVIIKENLDYSDPRVQARLENLLKKLEQSPHIGNSSLTESWLRFFLTFLKMKEMSWWLSAYNVSTEEGFIDALSKVFLKFPQTKHLVGDVVFDKDHTEILYSRFMVQVINMFDSEEEKAMMKEVRNIAEESDIPVSIYNAWFPLHEQLLTVREIATRNLIIATAVTLLAFFIFVPNILYSLCVALCVGSIEIGTIGMMSFWNVSLDLTSTTILVMCIGFSIDYSAHMCFAFASSKDVSWQARYEKSIRTLGFPIIQSASTTILGTVSLAFTDAYCYLVLFKIVFLVTVISAVHGLFVLPLLLNACEILVRKRTKSGTVVSASLPLNKENGVENYTSDCEG